MGIGDTVKSMLGQDQQGTTETGSRAARRTSRRLSEANADYDPNKTYDPDVLNDPSHITNSNRASHRLPSGTGIGTSGRGEGQVQQDLSTQGTSGYGGDTGGGFGGPLSSTQSGGRTSGIEHGASGGTGDTKSRTLGTEDINVGPTVISSPGSSSGQPMGGSQVQDRSGIRTHGVPSGHSGQLSSSGHSASEHIGHIGHAGVLNRQHDMGHSKRDVMPSGDTTEVTSQLNPVTHEHVRHLETEDVQRVMDHERHIHHIQHHTQPILASERLPETHRENIHNLTTIEEQHVNKVEDNTLFEGQVRQHRDTIDHTAKERTIIDKGTTVTENIHHHIHHVIQPVIEKNVVEQLYTHTKIPIREVTQEAPIVHQSQTHAPIPLEQFVDRGGVLKGGVSQDQIAKKVLVGGECTREVEGIAGDLERDLNLGTQKPAEPTYITTKVTKRTTVIDEPQILPTSRN